MGLLCLKFDIIIIVEASHYLNSVILFCKLKLPLLIQNTVIGKLSVLYTYGQRVNMAVNSQMEDHAAKECRDVLMFSTFFRLTHDKCYFAYHMVCMGVMKLLLIKRWDGYPLRYGY